MDSNETKRVLIVDDEKPLARALDLKLSSEGFETTVANNGESALKALEQHDFDVILLDLVMPQTDGFRVLQEIKRKQVTTHVIITSNLSQKEDEDKARELGADDYLIKSNVPIREVVKRVKDYLDEE